jgi:hypothetical protein
MVLSFFLLTSLAEAQSVTSIITDFNGWWKTNSAAPNPIKPNNSHNLLAFTYNGVQYSTGVKDHVLQANGETFVQGDFWSLPVNGMTGTITSSTKVGLGALYDGVSGGPSNPTPAWGIYPYLTDGIKGLDLGTCVANLPVGNMSFFINNIQPSAIGDGVPDILVTQVADPSGSFDRYEFTDANGVRVGNFKDIIFTNIATVGTWTADFYEANTNPMVLQAGFTQTDRPMRLWAADLSEFGITASNYTQIRQFRINLCGNSDVAFVAYNNTSVRFQQALPVQFGPFQATMRNGAVALGWQTTAEINADRFEIERRTDGREFRTIGEVKAANRAVGMNTYSFTDAQPLGGTTYYRLRQVDANGSASYSPVRKVEPNATGGVSVYPNPARGQLQLRHPQASARATVQVFSLAGVQLQQLRVTTGSRETTIALQQLPAGNYYLVYADETKSQPVRFIVQ